MNVGTCTSICNVQGPLNASTIRSVSSTTDRLVGDENHCATFKLGIRVRVVSDYLHIGRGVPEPLDLSILTQVVKGKKSFEEKLREFKKEAARLGIMFAKRQYTLRGLPCIPGSSLKGAVRSRIELGAYGRGSKVLAEMLYGNDMVPPSMPPPGMHGWRHARIWCESVFEPRVGSQPSVLDDLFGIAMSGLALSSRVYFSDLCPRDRVNTVILVLDHGETLEAVPRGTVFEGEILLSNVSLEEFGLILYGLGLDKSVLCGSRAFLLLGASKYRDRLLFRECSITRNGVSCNNYGDSGRSITLGVVEVEVVNIEYAPWSRCRFGSEADIVNLMRRALNAARSSYPELRFCFDEVRRRFQLKKTCKSRSGGMGGVPQGSSVS